MELSSERTHVPWSERERGVRKVFVGQGDVYTGWCGAVTYVGKCAEDQSTKASVLGRACDPSGFDKRLKWEAR